MKIRRFNESLINEGAVNDFVIAIDNQIRKELNIEYTEFVEHLTSIIFKNVVGDKKKSKTEMIRFWKQYQEKSKIYDNSQIKLRYTLGVDSYFEDIDNNEIDKRYRAYSERLSTVMEKLRELEKKLPYLSYEGWKTDTNGGMGCELIFNVTIPRTVVNKVSNGRHFMENL